MTDRFLEQLLYFPTFSTFKGSLKGSGFGFCRLVDFSSNLKGSDYDPHLQPNSARSKEPIWCGTVRQNISTVETPFYSWEQQPNDIRHGGVWYANYSLYTNWPIKRELTNGSISLGFNTPAHISSSCVIYERRLTGHLQVVTALI